MQNSYDRALPSLTGQRTPASRGRRRRQRFQYIRWWQQALRRLHRWHDRCRRLLATASADAPAPETWAKIDFAEVPAVEMTTDEKTDYKHSASAANMANREVVLSVDGSVRANFYALVKRRERPGRNPNDPLCKLKPVKVTLPPVAEQGLYARLCDELELAAA